MAKERADVLCVSQGLFESREKAKRAIMAGIVYNDNIRIDTHHDNKIMQRLLQENGFVHCGVIFLTDGSPLRFLSTMTMTDVFIDFPRYYCY